MMGWIDLQNKEDQTDDVGITDNEIGTTLCQRLPNAKQERGLKVYPTSGKASTRVDKRSQICAPVDLDSIN